MEQSKTVKKRIEYIDIARGIAIILMVIGHVVSGYKRAIIFSFHMPLFIIISGFFFKPGRNIKEEIKKVCPVPDGEDPENYIYPIIKNLCDVFTYETSSMF